MLKLQSYILFLSDIQILVLDTPTNSMPLSRRDWVQMLANQLDFFGLDSRMITPSGFRKGGMSHMLLCTGNLELLRLQGDWRSDSYKRYIVIPAELRFPVTQNAMQFMP